MVCKHENTCLIYIHIQVRRKRNAGYNYVDNEMRQSDTIAT